MLVVDASCLYAAIASTPEAEEVREIMRGDDEHVAPHLVDAEVFGIVRKHHELGRLDRTSAQQAISDLRDWPGERIGHRLLLARAWELRASVRGSDALYVALAEAMGATLVTLDRRLARAPGPRCEFELPEPR